MEKRIKFEEDTHTYWLDGVKIPSVSALIKCVFPNSFEGIPENVLENARLRGEEVHRLIEMYERYGFEDKESYCYDRFERYLELKKLFNFDVKEVELIVFYEDGIYRYAGTIDIVALYTDMLFLGDTKTFNRSLTGMKKDSEDYIKLQLQLTGYALAFEYLIKNGYLKQFDNRLVDMLKIIHIPNGKGKFLDIERNDELFLSKLKEHYIEMIEGIK